LLHEHSLMLVHPLYSTLFPYTTLFRSDDGEARLLVPTAADDLTQPQDAHETVVDRLRRAATHSPEMDEPRGRVVPRAQLVEQPFVVGGPGGLHHTDVGVSPRKGRPGLHHGHGSSRFAEPCGQAVADPFLVGENAPRA